jgi:flagellar L-ring protein precursor FlgH
MKIIEVCVPIAVAVWTLSAGPCTAADEAGSMFNPQTYHSLVSEAKALRVGDVLTVVVQETASASSSADLHTQRNFSLSGQASANKHGPYSAAISTGSQSDGTGSTDRSGRLLAQLSVRVLEVNPNGDLVVSGKQSLQINGEQQLITLNGLVRARDIGPDNTVLSSRIADARIQFAGRGFVASQSKPGWLARLFTMLGL